MKLIEFRPGGHTITLNILGEKWEGITYRCPCGSMIYLVGELPEVWRSNKNQVRFRIDYQYWYVAGHMSRFDELSDRIKTFHPFGNNWILSAKSGPKYPTIEGHIE